MGVAQLMEWLEALAQTLEMEPHALIVWLIAQAIGIIGMVINIFSMQCRKTSGVIIMLLIGSSFFGINYLLLGSYAGAVLNVFSVFRSLYLLSDKRKAKGDQLVVLSAVLLICGGVGIYFDGWIGLIPLLAQAAGTVGMWLRNGAKLRVLQLTLCSPLWLLNNVIVGSIGGIICEVFVISSVLISIARYGWKYLKESD